MAQLQILLEDQASGLRGQSIAWQSFCKAAQENDPLDTDGGTQGPRHKTQSGMQHHEVSKSFEGRARTLSFVRKREVVAEPVITRSMLFSSRKPTSPCLGSSCAAPQRQAVHMA